MTLDACAERALSSPLLCNRLELQNIYSLEEYAVLIPVTLKNICFILSYFIDLFERESGRTSRGAAGRGEAGFVLSRGPNAGLDPRTVDHDLSRRQMLDRQSHPAAPLSLVITSAL